MRIVGRYVCQVEIDLNVDENRDGLLPFDEIHKKFTGEELTDAMKNLVSSEFIDRDEGTVNVTKMYADVYRVEGEQE